MSMEDSDSEASSDGSKHPDDVEVEVEVEVEVKLEPSVAQILSTEELPNKPVLLVDRIVLFTLFHCGVYEEVYRLFLSDGERTIQALLHPGLRIPYFPDKVKEGSYLRLDGYEPRSGSKLGRHGKLPYIAIFDVHEIGWQRRFKRRIINRRESGELHDLTESEIDQYPRVKHLKKPCDYYRNNANFHVFRDPQPDDELLGYMSDLDRHYESESDDAQRTMKRTLNGSRIKKGKGYKRKRSSSTSTLPDLSPSQTNVSSRTRRSLKMKANSTTTAPADTLNGLPHPAKFYEDKVMEHFKRCQKKTFEHGGMCQCSSCGSRKEYKKMIRTSEEISNITLAATSLSQNAIRALETGIPLEPTIGLLWVRPLRMVLGRDFYYEHPLDVFAVVQWVDNKIIEGNGQFRSRNIRIVDSSTQKKVLLRVEVSPINFTPAVGTIALFRRLMYEKSDGGSLSARHFESAGHDWFIPNPVNIKGCDVDRLRKWWDKKQVEESKVRIELARIRAVMGSAKLAERCHPECVNDTVDYDEHEKLRKLGLALDPPDKEKPRWDTAILYNSQR